MEHVASRGTGSGIFPSPVRAGKLGPAAIPKILRALGEADKRQTVEYVEVLGVLINDKTLPVVVKGLADTDPRRLFPSLPSFTLP